MQGIAAPERGSALGLASTENLGRLIEGQEVVCKLDGTTAGRSRRPVGVCYVSELDLGAAQIEVGFARDCPKFSGGRYVEAEAKAVAAGRDLSEDYPLPSYCRR